MKKYCIAGININIEFIGEELNEEFKPFEITNKTKPQHKIVFQKVQEIKPLVKTNQEHSDGFKSYKFVEKEMFDIEDDHHNIVIRGCFDKDLTTFSFLDSFKEIKEYEYILSYMRFCEIASQDNYLFLHAKAINLGLASMIVTGADDNLNQEFVDKWLSTFDNCRSLSLDKVIVKQNGNFFTLYRNPWSKTPQDQSDETINLSHIICLEKSRKHQNISLVKDNGALLLASDLNIQNDDKTEEFLANFCLDLADYVDVVKYIGKIDDEGINQAFKKVYFN